MDYRLEFSKWWVNEFKTVKFPSQGTVFDYCIDPGTKKFTPWSEKVPSFELDPEVPLQVFLCVPVLIGLVLPRATLGTTPCPGHLPLEQPVLPGTPARLWHAAAAPTEDPAAARKH